MDERGVPPAARAEQETVKRWLGAHASHWHVDPSDAEVRQKLDVISRFCAFAEEGPDALVESLFRPTPEGPRIRVKRRREVIALIDEFERTVAGGDARQARAVGNTVRSFLIHNGVAL